MIDIILFNYHKPTSNCIIAILEKDYEADQYLENSLRYIFQTRTSFPIIYIEGTKEVYLVTLNHYYNLGYRVFIGFNRSTLLLEIIDWFNKDVVGISTLSNAPALNFPKNVIRLLGDATIIAERSITFLQPYFPNIHILYDKEDLYSTAMNDVFVRNGFTSHAVDPIHAPQELLSLISSLPSDAIVIILLLQTKGEYLTLLENLDRVPIQFDLAGVQPVFTYKQVSLFNGRYFIHGQYFDLDLYMREMRAALNGQFDELSLDAYNMARYICSHKNYKRALKYLLTSSGPIILNENNDNAIRPSIIYQYKDQQWKGHCIFRFTNSKTCAILTT